MDNNTINGMNELLVKMRAMASQAQTPVQAPQQISGAADQVGATKGTGGPDFATLLKDSVDSVNAAQQQAGALTDAFQRGDGNVQLAEVMVALQKANVSFEAMTQVRNKLVDAYKEIMNMPI